MVHRTYIVTYDISSQRRWRKVFRAMHGFGEHVQLSVFRCDLTASQRVRLRNTLEELIHRLEDQVLIIDLGPTSSRVIAGIDVIGRPRKFAVPSARVI